MGSGQSTRVLSFSNDEEESIIKLSDDIVHRLIKTTENVPDSTKEIRDTSSLVQSSPMHSGYYHPEYTMSALQMQQQKEQELNNLDNYWQRRLRKLERDHQNIDRIIQEEYSRAVGELSSDKIGRKEDTTNLIQPCLENSAKVLKCYQEHPKEVLRCSSLVEEFSNCVDQRRARIIASRC